MIPKIHDEPNFNLLIGTHQKCANNAGSISTTLGGGAHRYLALITPANTYFALMGAIFQPPTNPGPFPQIPPWATAAQIGHLERTHKEDKRLYQEYVAVGNVLKQQLIGVVDETYLRQIRHNFFWICQRLCFADDNIYVWQLQQHWTRWPHGE